MLKLDVKYNFDEKKVREKFERKRMAAQQYVNVSVVRLTSPFVPMRTGKLDESVIYGEATNFEQVIYNSPYARYLYEGKLMVGEKTKSAWARKDEKKILAVPERKLNIDQSRHPKAQSRWFEAMKKIHWDTIMEGAKKRFDNA